MRRQGRRGSSNGKGNLQATELQDLGGEYRHGRRAYNAKLKGQTIEEYRPDLTTFGKGGESFLRFNLATPRARVEEAVTRMQAAFADLQ